VSNQSQKTEQATPRKLQKARREGQFISARHFVSGMQFLAFVAIIVNLGAQWLNETKVAWRAMVTAAFQTNMGSSDLLQLCSEHLRRALFPLVEGGLILVLVTLAMQFGVTKMGVSLKKLAPNVQRLSPMSKLRELPKQNIPAFVQALILLPLMGGAVWVIAWDRMEEFFLLPLKSVPAGAAQVVGSFEDLLWKAAGVFVVFGAIDLFRQKQRYSKEMRMTKQEIRDEFKELEGNPQIKAQIRRIRRDLLRRRMMQEVPKATAVIVNPTHYAVAIRYQMGSMAAPVVLAKGKNYLALRIRKKALEHQIPLVENPPLAQALYKSAEVGQEIPAHLYRAVAEILAYIFRLMEGRLPA
jgi:flagellar biosynthetic protein FlhB